ncbi:MAG: hypothetical protein QXH42_00105 [Thermoplasmata archaeon]
MVPRLGGSYGHPARDVTGTDAKMYPTRGRWNPPHKWGRLGKPTEG